MKFQYPRCSHKQYVYCLLEHQTNTILTRVNISSSLLLKLVTVMMLAITQNVPEFFEGVSEIDEIYVRVQRRNKQRNRGHRRLNGVFEGVSRRLRLEVIEVVAVNT
jgi:hypothetical protein